VEWLQVLFLFLANAGLIIWFRTESRNDWRQTDQEFKQFREMWYQESRDFHERLLKIEENRK